MRTALVTAIYGGYDQPKPLPEDHGFDDAVLVTDHLVDVPGWRTLVEPSDRHPRLAAKRAKCLPWEYTDCDASVWIDGSYSLNTGSGFRTVTDRALALSDLVVWAHPETIDGPWGPGRRGSWDEAVFCHTWPKYREWPVIEQATHYNAVGLPDDCGLWALGTIGRRHTKAQQRLGQAWLNEIEQWSIQDQVSFPFVCWQRGITPTVWPAPQRANPWLEWSNHRDDD